MKEGWDTWREQHGNIYITICKVDTGNSDGLYLGGFKITADGDLSHEIKRRLLLGRKAMLLLLLLLSHFSRVQLCVTP